METRGAAAGDRMIAFAILMLMLPVGLLVVALIGAWLEGRRSEWSFGIGQVVSNIFAGIGGAPLLFLVTSFVLNALPQLGMSSLAGGMSMLEVQMMQYRTGNLMVVQALFGVLAWPLCQMILISAAIATLDGRSVVPRDVLIHALRRTPVAIVVTILFGLGFMLGLTVLIVPGILLLLTWFVVLPTVAVEDATILGSFGRSSELMRGMRWRLLVLLLLIGILWMVVSVLAGALTVAMRDTGLFGMAAVHLVSATLLGTIPPALLAAVYHEVRTAKGGIGTRDLEAVFA